MGAGKSTIGQLLSERLNKKFIDSDHEIERRTGVEIPLIFELEGEAGFRERERKVIAELTQRSSIILSTGGGAILAEENREALKRGIVIYLDISPEVQFERLKGDTTRPLLQQKEPDKILRELDRLRRPLYESIADITIKVDEQSPQVIVDALHDLLQKKPAKIGKMDWIILKGALCGS